jgi:2-hydroxy-3-oxopropionate reductase
MSPTPPRASAGIIEGSDPDLVSVDMSSIAPLAEQGVSMLDPSMSGGEPKAIDGTLSIVVGGERVVFGDFQAILAAMGSAVVHVGDVGAGNSETLARAHLGRSGS